MESNGRTDILEKDDVTDARNIHPGGNQVHSGSNEMAPHGAAQISDISTSTNFSSAFEGVGLKSWLPII